MKILILFFNSIHLSHEINVAATFVFLSVKLDISCRIKMLYKKNSAI